MEAARSDGGRVGGGLRVPGGADPRRNPCPCVNFNTGADNSVEFAEKVIETNYFGTKRMIEADTINETSSLWLPDGECELKAW